MQKNNPWKKISSKIVYKNPWLQLREDDVIRPDGSPGIYSVLEIGTSVGIVAVNENDQIILVGQWRYVHDKYSWEIPTGGIKDKKALPIEVAKRELKEETGLIAGNWVTLGTIDNSNGATDDVAHLFFATNLEQTEKELEPTEDITTKWILFEDALKMVLEGQITESCSVASILKVSMIRNSKTEP